jgi:V/A-type H+-transporting ATPase subunit I
VNEEDNVPTLIRNPRWISMISPVFKLIEVLPGYHELDISLWFLIFLSIFFGMLVGDAAYGVIFLLLTIFSRIKWGNRARNKSIFFLLYLLSSCVIVWGVLTGTFFGQQWLPGWVRPLMPALRNDKSLQEICFLIGAAHLSIARLWRAALKAPSPKALADIGWTVILWGGFFLARMLVLGESFPVFGKWLFISGTTLVIFFTDPRKNMLKGTVNGISSFFLSVVNSFTDIVSYIRLFAVGLATVAVADSFNSMAMDLGFGSPAAGALAAIILFVGHALNIMLAPMSVLVHGVRLNVLEFCSHVDIKWGGFSYKPLEDGKQV